MNVNANRSPKAPRGEESRGASREFRSPAELLCVLAPAGPPEPVRHSGLWKMGPEPQAA